MSSFYDPEQHISYVELNKRRRGEYARDAEDRIENRTQKPAVKKIYVKRNGESRSKKPKLFVWRQWQSPTLKHLLEDVGPYVGLDNGAGAMYDLRGRRITHEDDVDDLSTYYVLDEDSLLIPDSDDEYNDASGSHPQDRRPYSSANRRHTTTPRYTSLSAPEYPTQSRHSIYDSVSNPLTPPPKPFQPKSVAMDPEEDYEDGRQINNNNRAGHVNNRTYTVLPNPSKAPLNEPPPPSRPTSRANNKRDYNMPKGNDMDEYEQFYNEALSPTGQKAKKTKKTRQARKPPRREYYDYEEEARQPGSALDDYPSRSRQEPKYRSRSVNDDFKRDPTVSDFHDDDAQRKDKDALAKHKEKVAAVTRRYSAVIYNRRDQTHPDAYIMYVFLNGHGMDCQFISFQKNQLEKGMHYVLELIARRFNVNPWKLCNMDGKKIVEVSDLMSRGAYVLVAAGQSFRDTWYFLPDNAIDTSSNQHRIDERSAQRDRMIQRRDKKNKGTTKNKNRFTYTAEHQQVRSRSQEALRRYPPTPGYTSNNRNYRY